MRSKNQSAASWLHRIGNGVGLKTVHGAAEAEDALARYSRLIKRAPPRIYTRGRKRNGAGGNIVFILRLCQTPAHPLGWQSSGKWPQ
ncbi:hypothetical protein BG74_01040 [Sodalis-like endosymbiont of Proechinophthirus fluctus]|nr:hypothetical protein BG74_01040 [Sodalis-like endosymbiont of Proechinophthirus fluctus]